MYQAAEFERRRPELLGTAASEVIFLVFASGFGSSSPISQALREYS